MFKKEYGNILIEEAVLPKRGRCLVATRMDTDFSIYMDIVGVNIPDGVNCYAFGNKLIFVTRWSDFSDDEVDMVLNENISLGVFPARLTNHFMIKFGDFQWGDVFTSHGIIPDMNDINNPVDEAIFIFYDRLSGDFIGERSVKLPENLQNTFAFGNKRVLEAYKNSENNYLNLFYNLFHGESETIKNFARQSIENETQDWCDILYDECHALIEPEASNIRAWEPEEFVTEVRGVILVEIEENQVIHVSQNK